MSTTTYTKAQLALIEKHRGINVDCDWWDCVYDDSKEVCAAFGIDIDDIAFSGFYSQGDGASFTTITSTLEEIMRRGHATMDAKTYGDDPTKFTGVVLAAWSFWYDIAEALDAVRLTGPEGHEFCEGVEIKVETQGNYSHSGTMSLTYESSFSVHVGATLYEFHKIAPTEEALVKGLRNIADAIYKALEAEHEHLTSDAQVWEAIEANELDSELEETCDA